jgi:hypothetical protein
MPRCRRAQFGRTLPGGKTEHGIISPLSNYRSGGSRCARFRRGVGALPSARDSPPPQGPRLGATCAGRHGSVGQPGGRRRLCACPAFALGHVSSSLGLGAPSRRSSASCSMPATCRAPRRAPAGCAGPMPGGAIGCEALDLPVWWRAAPASRPPSPARRSTEERGALDAGGVSHPASVAADKAPPHPDHALTQIMAPARGGAHPATTFIRTAPDASAATASSVRSRSNVVVTAHVTVCRTSISLILRQCDGVTAG